MHDRFVAVGTATDLRVHASELRRRWDDSFASGRPDGVRAVVADSWERMIAAGLEPDRLRPVQALDDDALAAAREASPLRLVLPQLRACLGGLADDAEHIVVVCDADGRLLWLDGHGRVLEQAQGIEFRAGMSWTETSAGTNAIGTALAIDHAVQLFSAEHFLAEQHPWWCSAAPIHDPGTGALLGVVDLSGPQRTAHPHSLGLVMAAAAIAEEGLAQHQRSRAARAVERASRRPRARAVGAPRARARLSVLTEHRPVLAVPGAGQVVLSLRQAEVLTLLALHPDGMTAERLTLELYGDRGNPVTTRALVSRLRDLVPDVVETRPYRLAEGVVVDLLTVRRLLSDGDGAAALAMYPGPLLGQSEVEGVVAARHEVDSAVRGVALGGDADAVWRWLQTPSGEHDLAAVERFLAVAAADDPRVALADARRRVLLDDWG